MKPIQSAWVVAGVALSLVSSHANAATKIIQDGTFQNAIGTPWIDHTGVGITQVTGSNLSIGNFASLPVGADLYQRFSPLTNGNYSLSFLYQNQSPNAAALVYDVQQGGGTPVEITFALGFGREIHIPSQSDWIRETINFTVNSPNFLVDELTFSNSYDAPVPLISDSINPPGTIINIADVSLFQLDGAVSGAPEPSTWLLLLLGFGAVGSRLRAKKRRRYRLIA